jgi:hypothetical protein
MSQKLSPPEINFIEQNCGLIIETAKEVIKHLLGKKIAACSQFKQSGSSNQVFTSIGANGSILSINNFQGVDGHIYDIEIRVREPKN